MVSPIGSAARAGISPRRRLGGAIRFLDKVCKIKAGATNVTGLTLCCLCGIPMTVLPEQPAGLTFAKDDGLVPTLHRLQKQE
jgi:hypothetical protein